jgi:hypothetical protein
MLLSWEENAVTAGNQCRHQQGTHRRELLNENLQNYRQEKLRRKILVDTQLLECAKEEEEEMYSVEKEYSETMTKLSSNMEKLTNSITDGLSLLRNLLAPQPQPMYPPYPPSMYSSNTHADIHQQRP